MLTAAKPRRTNKRGTVAPKPARSSMVSLPVRFALWNVPLGHKVAPPTPPDFGPPKFTKEEQEANPDKPMTRVVKDVVHVGVAKVGYDDKGNAIPWNITQNELALLNSSSTERLQVGDPINIIKGHGDEELNAHPDDIVSSVDEVKLSNGVLWVSSYVTPEQAKYLLNPARKVSIGAQRNYTHGDLSNGEKVYPIAMKHVGLVDNPAQLRQGSFLALANLTPKGSGSMSQELIDAINETLSALGVGPLPEGISDEAGLILVLKTVASSNGGGEKPAEPTPADASGGKPAADAMAGMANGVQRFGMGNVARGGFFAQLSNVIKSEMKPLRDEIESLKGEKIATAKEDYIAFETELGKAGVAAVVLSNKRKIAEKCGWDKAVLDGLHPTITMSNRSKANASAAAPEVPGATAKLSTDDEVAARLKARGIDPKYMPKTV